MRPSLKILDIFVGNKCNLTCFQCDTRSDIIRTGKQDPTLESIKESIVLAQKHFKIETYSLLGGEPLLYLDKIQEIVSFIRDYDTVTRIVLPTNGTVLNKYMDRLVSLVKQYNVCVAVCDHFAGFEDPTRSNKLSASVEELVSRLELSPQAPSEFWQGFLDWQNVGKDPLWQSFVDVRGSMIEQGDIVYANEKIWVQIKSQSHFQSHYKLVDGKPKPFMSGDPATSYSKSCPSTFCSFMQDKKLYKCGALGTLHRFLDYYNVQSDPDWQKYISYKPLDLENCTQEEVEHFSNTKYCHIDECDMCPAEGGHFFLKTPDKVIPIRST